MDKRTQDVNMYNYSFIIPHRDNIQLLRRCLDSIPQRGDVQIIVVDDGSKCQKEVLSLQRNNLEVIPLSSNGKGAGFVRNQGLPKAKGKWVLFIDCDDFYATGVLDVLDRYCNTNIDILFFNFRGVYNDTLQPYERYNKTSNYYDDYDGSMESLDRLRYLITMPWNKMILRSFIERYGINFEEVPKGNDVRFSFMVGYLARRFAIETTPLYYWTQQPHSITHQHLTLTSSLSVLKMRFKSQCFLSYVGIRSHGLISLVARYFLYNGLKDALLILVVYFMRYNEIHKEEKSFIDYLNRVVIP